MSSTLPYGPYPELHGLLLETVLSQDLAQLQRFSESDANFGDTDKITALHVSLLFCAYYELYPQVQWLVSVGAERRSTEPGRQYCPDRVGSRSKIRDDAVAPGFRRREDFRSER